MRTGLAVSVVGHLVILAWGAFTLASPTPLETVVEAVPVDLIPVGDITKLDKGKETAELIAKPSPNDPNDKPADEPRPAPPRPKPEPKPEPPPPPPPPPPTPPPPQAAAPEPPPKPEPPPPPPEPPPPPPDAAPPEPPPPETPPPEPAPTPEPPKPPAAVKSAAATPPLPRIRPRPPTPPTEPKKNFDDKITALLTKSDASLPAAASDSPATVGSSQATADTVMTQNEMDALKAKIQSCWTIPPGATSADEVRTVVTIRFNQDGSLASEPEITSQPAGRFSSVAPESVIRAIKQCAPYSLPPEKYAGENGWNAVAIDFYPTTLF